MSNAPSARLLLLLLPLSWGAGGSLLAQAPLLTTLGGSAGVGAGISTSALLDNPQDASGWSLTICHDPAVIELVDFGHGADALVVNGGGTPDFASFNQESFGFSVGVIISFLGMAVLPPGSFEIVAASYTALAEGTTTLCPCPIGSPPITSVVVIGGSSVPMDLSCGEWTVTPPLDFIRGDVDQSGAVDLTDAIAGLAFLFEGGGLNCEAAVDANADGLADLSDPVTLLAWLFGSGPSPGGAFPDCEADPTLQCPTGAFCP